MSTAVPAIAAQDARVDAARARQLEIRIPINCSCNIHQFTQPARSGNVVCRNPH